MRSSIVGSEMSIGDGAPIVLGLAKTCLGAFFLFFVDGLSESLDSCVLRFLFAGY